MSRARRHVHLIPVTYAAPPWSPRRCRSTAKHAVPRPGSILTACAWEAASRERTPPFPCQFFPARENSSSGGLINPEGAAGLFATAFRMIHGTCAWKSRCCHTAVSLQCTMSVYRRDRHSGGAADARLIASFSYPIRVRITSDPHSLYLHQAAGSITCSLPGATLEMRARVIVHACSCCVVEDEDGGGRIPT